MTVSSGSGSGKAIGFRETRDRLAADRIRLREALAVRTDLARGALWLLPSYQAVWLHRWSHFFFERGNRLLSRFLWHLNVLLTGADISPLTDLGGGFVLIYPVSTVVLGKAGRNLTVVGHGGFGGGMSSVDIGAGPGLPVFGDNVCLELGAFVLGPVRVGHNVEIRARSLVTADVPDNCEVASNPSRIRKRAALLSQDDI